MSGIPPRILICFLAFLTRAIIANVSAVKIWKMKTVKHVLYNLDETKLISETRDNYVFKDLNI